MKERGLNIGGRLSEEYFGTYDAIVVVSTCAAENHVSDCRQCAPTLNTINGVANICHAEPILFNALESEILSRRGDRAVEGACLESMCTR